MARKIINATEANNVNNSESAIDNTVALSDSQASESEAGASESESEVATTESEIAASDNGTVKKHFYMAHTILHILKVKGKLPVVRIMQELLNAGHERIDSAKLSKLLKEIIQWQFASFKNSYITPCFSSDISLVQLIKDYNLAWAADMRARNGKELKTIRKESKPKLSPEMKMCKNAFNIETELASLESELSESIAN